MNLLLLTILAACSREVPFHDRPYPRVKLIISESDLSVKMSATIDVQTYEILDQGFVYSLDKDPAADPAANWISLDPAGNEKNFDYTLAYRFGYGNKYFLVRAYVQTKDFLVYSDSHGFIR